MRLNNKGFTLVEVLAVVVILAIIGGIAVNGVLSSINKSKEASYNLMRKDVFVASQTMYEEISFGNEIFQYTIDGSIGENVSISDGEIVTNLQTLISNGFLSGTENSCKGNTGCNKNNRIIINPITGEDIGDCNIIIKKSSGDFIVLNNSSGISKCPSSYEKEVK